jgi:hypothetical protein
MSLVTGALARCRRDANGLLNLGDLWRDPEVAHHQLSQAVKRAGLAPHVVAVRNGRAEGCGLFAPKRRARQLAQLIPPEHLWVQTEEQLENMTQTSKKRTREDAEEELAVAEMDAKRGLLLAEMAAKGEFARDREQLLMRLAAEGNFCNGGFNWGPEGVMSSELQQLDPLSRFNPIISPGVNCAIDTKNRTCKHNRIANADSNGDIIYKNLGWQLDHACAQIPQTSCENVHSKFGLCTWDKSTKACTAGTADSAALLPLCLTSIPLTDCKDSSTNGSYCYPKPESPGLLGICKGGKCNP